MNTQDLTIRSAFDEYVAGLDLPEFAAPFTASPDFPWIQYHKGVTVVAGMGVRPVKHTAWHVAPEQDPDLDNLFAAMNVPLVRVRHYNKNENNFWQLDSLDGYLLCRAVPVKYAPDAWEKSGIAYVWNDHKDTYNYGSQLQVLFFVKGLLDLGYTQPLVLSLSRTVTKRFVSMVLRRQEAFLTAVKKALLKAGRKAELASYAYWLTLAPDKEEVGEGGGSYHPPVMVIDPPLTRDYLIEHQIVPEHLEIIEGFIPLWDTWAQSASQRLQEPPRDNNDTSQQAEPGEENPVPTAAQTAKQPERDDTIIISGNVPEPSMLAVYNAVWQAKQRGIRGGALPDEAAWWTLLSELGVDAFTQAHIGPLNRAITALLQVQEAEKALPA